MKQSGIFHGINYIFSANFAFYITNRFIYPAYEPKYSLALSLKLNLLACHYVSRHMYSNVILYPLGTVTPFLFKLYSANHNEGYSYYSFVKITIHA